MNKENKLHGDAFELHPLDFVWVAVATVAFAVVAPIIALAFLALELFR